MNPSSRTLSTAEARRETLVESAVHVFAERGFHGTPTAEVAKAAGISQAYLFRLFPTKTELYVAAVARCFERTLGAFKAAAADAKASGREVLPALGEAYAGLLADRDALLGQLQAHAAAVNDPAVRDAVRRGFARLYEFVAQASLASDEEVQEWFARGMLLNVLVAMDAPSIDEPWARALLAPPG
ncbi:MAG TPA: TetR/AcrR family transcriptional regulator [Solirubrobacteraceae bacterium]